jgi:NhaP-type Na+/H+ or K+/H+ antiporter
MLAAFLLVYSAVAGRVEWSWVSGPIVFTVVGLMLGPYGLGVLHINISGEGLRILAELTLAMVLFTDAANAISLSSSVVSGLPERLLLIGLPLTIVLGFLIAAIVFPSLATLELVLLAAMLAPTDAALGKPVVTNPTVPPVMRESLNLESGLNDGICVPIVVVLLGLVVGTQIGRPGSSGSDRYRADRRSSADLVNHLDAALCRAARLDQRVLGGNPDRRAGRSLLCRELSARAHHQSGNGTRILLPHFQS